MTVLTWRVSTGYVGLQFYRCLPFVLKFIVTELFFLNTNFHGTIFIGLFSEVFLEKFELFFLNINFHGTIFMGLFSEIFLEKFRLSLHELNSTSGITSVCPEVGTTEILQDSRNSRRPFPWRIDQNTRAQDRAYFPPCVSPSMWTASHTRARSQTEGTHRRPGLEWPSWETVL